MNSTSQIQIFISFYKIRNRVFYDNTKDKCTVNTTNSIKLTKTLAAGQSIKLKKTSYQTSMLWNKINYFYVKDKF